MMADEPNPPIHEDRDLFRQAIEYTAAERSFNPRIIEKDYYCSLVLKDFEPLFATTLVFKGGTALSKVHAGFYRLSEDLDFVISVPVETNRKERRAHFEPVRMHLAGLAQRAALFREAEALKGANLNSHYTAVLDYESCLSGERETIRIEVGLREPLLEASQMLSAETMLLNPLTRTPALSPIAVNAMSRREAYAEKIRAALTRRDPAIRDVFDLDHACRAGILNAQDQELLALARRKLSVPDNDPPNLSDERLQAFRLQLETQLHPVLRREDAERFDLEAAFALLRLLEQNTR